MATLEGTHGEDKEERLTARVFLKGLAKYLLFGTVGYWIVAFIFMVFYRIILYDVLFWGVAWTTISAAILWYYKTKPDKKAS